MYELVHIHIDGRKGEKKRGREGEGMIGLIRNDGRQIETQVTILLFYEACKYTEYGV